MEVIVRSLGGKQTEATTRGHRVVCDQPETKGGADNGMTPPELFISALGTCSMHYAVEFLRARGLSTKRSLALREFALGIEALERFVRKEPLRRVHEAVFGVLALESEPVDPRL